MAEQLPARSHGPAGSWGSPCRLPLPWVPTAHHGMTPIPVAVLGGLGSPRAALAGTKCFRSAHLLVMKPRLKNERNLEWFLGLASHQPVHLPALFAPLLRTKHPFCRTISSQTLPPQLCSIKKIGYLLLVYSFSKQCLETGNTALS